MRDNNESSIQYYQHKKKIEISAKIVTLVLHSF